MYTAYVDGACSPNPGRGSYGFVIYNNFRKVTEDSGVAGKHTTNNIAEYASIIKAMEKMADLGVKIAEIRSDSELAVSQINGLYAVRDPELQKMHKKVNALLRKFTDVCFIHIPRSQNQEADRLANRVFETPDTRQTRAAKLAENVFVKTENGFLFVKEDDLYHIDLEQLTCTCPDKLNRGGMCKHLMAAGMLDETIQKHLVQGGV